MLNSPSFWNVIVYDCDNAENKYKWSEAGRQSVNLNGPQRTVYCTIQICNHQLIREGWWCGIVVLGGIKAIFLFCPPNQHQREQSQATEFV